MSSRFLVQDKWLSPGDNYMNHVRGEGGLNVFVCACAKQTGRVKNCLGECSLKVTYPHGECSEILVSNPVLLNINMFIII